MGLQVYISAFTCNIIAFVGGTVITWSSPVAYNLQNGKVEDSPFGRLITKDESAWISATMPIGGVFGPLFFAYLCGKIGRKYSTLGLSVPFIISYSILAFAKTLPLYYGARIIAGLGIGGLFTILPVYIGEIAEDSNRGALGALLNCFITAGLLFSYCVGPYTSIMAFNIILLALPVIFAVLFFFIVPESPHYYISKGNEHQAEIILQQLRQSQEISKELVDIKEADQKAKIGSPMDLFKYRGLRKGLITSLALIALQQFSGITAVLFFAQSIFKNSGSSIEPALSSIIIGGVQFLTSFVTPLLADRLGRKLLLLISAIGMALSEIPLGIYFFLQKNPYNVEAVSWLPIVCLVVYIITYNLAFAGLPWAIMGELFPPSVKGLASSLTSSFCWMLAFFITQFFEKVADAIGMDVSFWIFAGFCVLAAFFVHFYLIETKGKSLQEIQDLLER